MIIKCLGGGHMGFSGIELSALSIQNSTRNVEQYLAWMRDNNRINSNSLYMRNPKNPQDLKSIQERNALQHASFMFRFKHDLLFRLIMSGRFDLIREWITGPTQADLAKLRALKKELDEQQRINAHMFSDPFQELLKLQREKERNNPTRSGFDKVWNDYYAALQDMLGKKQLYETLSQTYQNLSHQYYSRRRQVFQQSHANAAPWVNAVVNNTFLEPLPSAPQMPSIYTPNVSAEEFREQAEFYVNSLLPRPNITPERLRQCRSVYLNELCWEQHIEQTKDKTYLLADGELDVEDMQKDDAIAAAFRNIQLQQLEYDINNPDTSPEIQNIAIAVRDMEQQLDVSLVEIDNTFKEQINQLSTQMATLRAELNEDYDARLNSLLEHLVNKADGLSNEQLEAIQNCKNKVKKLQNEFKNIDNPSALKSQKYLETISPLVSILTPVLQKLEQKPNEYIFSSELKDLILAIKAEKQGLMSQVMIKTPPENKAAPLPIQENYPPIAAYRAELARERAEAQAVARANHNEEGLDQKHIEPQAREEVLPTPLSPAENIPDAMLDNANDYPPLEAPPIPDSQPHIANFKNSKEMLQEQKSLENNQREEVKDLIEIPEACQDEWMAFVEELFNTTNEINEENNSNLSQLTSQLSQLLSMEIDPEILSKTSENLAKLAESHDALKEFPERFEALNNEITSGNREAISLGR